MTQRQSGYLMKCLSCPTILAMLMIICMAAQSQSQPSPANGVTENRWTYSTWTGDADSGIVGASGYTMAVNCGGPTVTVNGLVFQADALSGANFSIKGGVDKYPSSASNLTGDSATLAATFIYGGNPRTVTLTNLTPGATYETSFYAYGFEDSGRRQVFETDGVKFTVDQSLYGRGNGIRICCRFVTNSSGSKRYTITPEAGTFHMSALANRKLSDAPRATILSFGRNIPGCNAVFGLPVGGKADIVLTVPYGTKPRLIAAFKPAFTLSSGTCNRVSGSVPSPKFGKGLVTYTVTDGEITNVYAVKVVITPPSMACVLKSIRVNLAGSRVSVVGGGGKSDKVVIHVPAGTTAARLAALKPTLMLSPNATCAIPSPPLKLATPVRYIVKAEDGITTKAYSVTTTNDAEAYQLFVVNTTIKGLAAADYDYLSAIPASKHRNNGVPAVCAISSASDFYSNVYLQDFVRRYKPTAINTINFTAKIPTFASHSINATGPLELSVSMATSTWASSRRVVLVSDTVNATNYPNVLQASALASALDAPLMYFNPQPAKLKLVRSAITRLKATEVVYVSADGTKPAMANLVLKNPAMIVSYLAGKNRKVRYFAATNPKDTELISGSKISLTAPFIAARRAGIVVPITSYVPNTSERFHYTGYPLINAELRKLYQSLGRYPDYLVLVGSPTSIPLSYSAPNEVAGSLNNAPTDLDYADVDADQFPDIAIGRIMAYNIFDTTLYACRISTYNKLFDGAWEKNMYSRAKSPLFTNYGFQFKEFTHADVAANKPFDGAFYGHGEHSAQSVLGLSFSTGSRNVLSPMFIHSTGCATAAIDFETLNDGQQPPAITSGELLVVNTLVRMGAVAFLGSTRLCCGEEAAMSGQFYADLLKGETLGRCYVRGVTVKSLNAKNDWFMDIRRNWILLGDPAFRLNIPASPVVPPASHVVTKESANTDILTVNAAPYSDRFRTEILPEYVREWGLTPPRYWLSWPGLFSWEWNGESGNRLAYNVRHTTKRLVTDVQQLGSYPANLGMDCENGNGWTINRNQDGTMDVLWNVRLLDFDWAAGKVVNQLSKVTFRITYAADTPASKTTGDAAH